jgi:ABC-type molybdate transport system substrate-binding protein
MTPRIRTAGPSALKILTSHSSFTVLDALAPDFERAAGQQYSVEADGAKAMLARIKGGETADVVVLVGCILLLGLGCEGARYRGLQAASTRARP